MIPFIHVPDLHIGPLPLHPFGILVATGVFVGTSITTRRARALGYDVEELNSFVTWMLVTAFLVSHVLDSLFYHWDDVVTRPWSLLMPWTGLSSFGGFVGAILGIVAWKYLIIDERGRPHRRPRPAPILPFADLVLSVFPIGWMFGRAGCSTVHDHLGARAMGSTILAVARPLDLRQLADGTWVAKDGPVTRFGFIEFFHGHDARFDLGLLELMFTTFLAACFALTWRRRLPVGSYVIVAAMAYAPVRFVMDFFRLPDADGGDARYFGLTPAQYGCILLFIYGVAMIPYVRRLYARGGDPPAPGVAPSATPEGPPLTVGGAATR